MRFRVTARQRRFVADASHELRSPLTRIRSGLEVDLDDIVPREGGRLRAQGRLRVDCSGVSAAQVSGDAEQLARAVRNLADNAARYADGRVWLTLAEHDHTAVLTVADDGPGIPPEHHQRVFERFTRLDQARSATTGGAGLGLAIVLDIVRRHRGTIVIDPRHQPGARFIVTLPTAGTAEPAAEAVEYPGSPRFLLDPGWRAAQHLEPP